jgi:DNA replication protein DnaC
MSTAAQHSSEASCPHCRGTGWRVTVASGQSQAVRCECQSSHRFEKLLEAAHIPRRYFHCTLDDYDPQYGGTAPLLVEARLIATRFADEYPANDGNGLLFIGPCGVGKTHLAVGIIRRLMEEKGILCRFADCRDLLKDIQRTFDPANPASEASVVDPLLDAEVLVLDDLGVGRATEWALEVLHYILNRRYAEKATTLLTTNLEDVDPKRTRLADGTEYEREKPLAQAIGTRLRSRLYEMCRPIEMQGEDFRRRIQQGNVIERGRDDAARFR